MWNALLLVGSLVSAPTFVVVAPRGFHDALRDYVTSREDSGLPTELAALEEILATSSGADDPEKLKRWLHARWQEGARYALLVGDADVMPVRYMVLDRVTGPAFDYAFYPSDLYYADLATPDGSFEDWNAWRDSFHAGYFGEVRGEKNKDGPINADRIDYRPEIAVGRWPVSTAEEAARVAAKTIRTEQAVPARSHAGAGRTLLVHCDGWVDARPLFDRLAERLGAVGEGVAPTAEAPPAEAPSVLKLYDGTDSPPTEERVLEALARGVALVCHGGHGQPDGWERSLRAGAIARIRNADRLPVVMSVGCSTAQFATLPPYEAYVDVDGHAHRGTNAGEVFESPPPPPAPYQRGAQNTTGLGERLLRDADDGAVAYIGCNTGSQPCGLTLLEGFVGAVAKAPRLRLGDCWNEAIRHYVTQERLMELTPTDSWYPPSVFFQGMKFMLFGDPTLEMAVVPG